MNNPRNCMNLKGKLKNIKKKMRDDIKIEAHTCMHAADPNSLLETSWLPNHCRMQPWRPQVPPHVTNNSLALKGQNSTASSRPNFEVRLVGRV